MHIKHSQNKKVSGPFISGLCAVKDNGTIKGGWHSFTHFTNIYWATHPAPGTGPRTVDSSKHIGGTSPQGLAIYLTIGQFCYHSSGALGESHVSVDLFSFKKHVLGRCNGHSTEAVGARRQVFHWQGRQKGKEIACQTEKRVWPRGSRYFLGPTEKVGMNSDFGAWGKAAVWKCEEELGSRTLHDKGNGAIGDTVKNEEHNR